MLLVVYYLTSPSYLSLLFLHASRYSTNKVTYAFKDDDGNWVTGATKVSMGKTWLPFDDARDFVRTLKLDSLRAWHEYAKSGKRPNNIPSSPDTVYVVDGGWVSYPDWMGYVSF